MNPLDVAAGIAPFVLRPSEYTAALIQAVRAEPARVRGASVLEIGSGSGVVLAALAALGAKALCGVDIEGAAVATGETLMRTLGHHGISEFHRGDMWQPVAGRRFDLIVANLPHFAMEPVEIAGRLPTWSAGGADGRHVLDPFLEGLVDHLAPGGRAVLTHNGFVDLERSRALVARHGLALRILSSILVHVPDEKLDCMTVEVVCREQERSIHRIGPYAFADVHVVEVASARR